MLKNVLELQTRRNDWDDLFDSVSERSDFFGSKVLLDYLRKKSLDEFRFLFLSMRDYDSKRQRCVAFFPFHLSRKSDALPFLELLFLQPPDETALLPLIRPGFEDISAAALLNWWRNELKLPKMLTFSGLDSDGLFLQHLRTQLVSSGLGSYEDSWCAHLNSRRSYVSISKRTFPEQFTLRYVLPVIRGYERAETLSISNARAHHSLGVSEDDSFGER